MRETTRIEGLLGGNGGAVCSSVLPVGATLPAGSRKISTQWHPDWKLPVQVSEPGRRTTYVYNGQPDPFAGNATASCAPTNATLIDGKPIVVLCRQVEQATTDANGAQGLTAALQSGVANREQKWTYNGYGQVLTHDGPRTDVADVTTYAYYSDTTADHMPGDLRSLTNAAGHLTQYTKYDKNGQLLESVDANGTVTTMTYDARQRLLTQSVGGQLASYEYWPNGLLKKATQPDASFISYGYDAAQRLTSITDSSGNSITYTLDNSGNRTAEQVKDVQGTLRRQLTRAFDALGRVQQTTGTP